MRVNRIFSIEMEHVEKLQKEENMSEVVNKALSAYFNDVERKLRAMTPEERALRVKELELEKEYKDKLRGLHGKK